MVLGKLPVPGRPTFWIIAQILGVSNFCVLGHPDHDPSS